MSSGTATHSIGHDLRLWWSWLLSVTPANSNKCGWEKPLLQCTDILIYSTGTKETHPNVKHSLSKILRSIPVAKFMAVAASWTSFARRSLGGNLGKSHAFTDQVNRTVATLRSLPYRTLQRFLLLTTVTTACSGIH
jgi:hypothetical protein